MSTSTICFLAMQGHPDYVVDDDVREPLDYSGGMIKFSERPGLGVEIDPDKRKRFEAAYVTEGMSTAYAASGGGQVLSVPPLQRRPLRLSSTSRNAGAGRGAGRTREPAV